MNLYKRVIKQQRQIYQSETLGFDQKLVNITKDRITKKRLHNIKRLQNKKS